MQVMIPYLKMKSLRLALRLLGSGNQGRYGLCKLRSRKLPGWREAHKCLGVRLGIARPFYRQLLLWSLRLRCWEWAQLYMFFPQT